MARTISGLVPADTLDGSELIETVQAGNTRRTTTQDIADLGGGGGGGGNTIYTGDGALAGDRTVDLDGHKLDLGVNGGGSPFIEMNAGSGEEQIIIKSVGDAGSTYLQLASNTDGSPNTFFRLDADNGTPVNIIGNSDNASLAYTADTHTFNGNVGIGVTPDNVFQVRGGSGVDNIQVSNSGFTSTIQGSDGISTTRLSLSGDIGDPYVAFDLFSYDGTNTVEIFGNALDQTIAFTAANGMTLNGNPIGGPTIYTGDGALSGDRVVDLDGHSLSFGNTSANKIAINPGSVARMTVTDPTDGGNYGHLSASVTTTDAHFNTTADFNDGVKRAEIEGTANATESTIFYTADTHTFNGVINLPVQAAPASPNDGDIWRESNTNTGLKIRINGTTKTITVS